jgi:hypothetical protein
LEPDVFAPIRYDLPENGVLPNSFERFNEGIVKRLVDCSQSIPIVIPGTRSGTRISLACLRQIRLKYGGDGIYASARLAKITLVYHRFTVFAANLKFAGREAVGVQVPLRAPYKTVNKSVKMKCLC